ncbi:retrovirus-related pol polyprotein from transposon TNT 1-94 [Tanacetum coccineum]
MKVEESLNVTFDETPPLPKTSPLEDDDLVEEEAIEVNKTRPLGNDLKDKSLENNEIINIKESKSHPLDNVIGNLNQRTLRSQAQDKSNFFCFLSTIEPKNINKALKDKSWVMAMQKKLNQFISNDVWELVPNPMDMTIIRTKWVYRNKLDENGVVTRNKARLVAQGYNQQEIIDYDETYAPVARLESIRILLAYACSLDFKLFQMDVKSAFLNGFINEEVYVVQPSRFIDFAKPNHVYRLKKALYRLKQAPKAWYDRLKAFLIKYDYPMGMVKMDDPNITMEEYIRLEEEKARRRGKVYNWETATYVFNDTLTSEAALSCEPTVSSLNNDEIDFRISFDESDNEDCTVIFDKKSFSYKIIYVNGLKTDLENDNDKVDMPCFLSLEPTVSYFDDLDFFKDYENKFPAIVYNDALTSKLDFLTEPSVSPQHIDEFDLKDETSLSECDEEEHNILYFNDLFSFNVIYPNDSKSNKDNDNKDISVIPLPNVINNDDGAYAQRTSREKKSTNIGGEFTNLEILKCWSLETSRLLFNTQSCS